MWSKSRMFTAAWIHGRMCLRQPVVSRRTEDLGMKRWIVLFIVGICIARAEANAHHSIAGVYDGGKKVTIEGVVTEFRFVNPHPFVMVEVKQEGRTDEWKLEMRSE